MDFARRKFLGVSAATAALAAIGTTAQPATAAITSSTLKGIGYGDKSDADVAKINSLNPDWWYNWNQKRFFGAGTVTAPFVPMLWSDNQTRLDTLAADLDSLNMPHQILGFNEPDHPKQANMTTGDARRAWRDLEAAASVEKLRIGSPAAISPDAWWMNRFMIDSTELEDPDLKIDFVACHIYQDPSANNFFRKVDELHDRWGKPVWVTETAVADFSIPSDSPTLSTRYTRSQVNQYIKDIWAGAQSRPWLERIAWKTRAATDPQMWFSALFNADGSLTGTGQTWRDLNAAS
jgi:hypothetical protein